MKDKLLAEFMESDHAEATLYQHLEELIQKRRILYTKKRCIKKSTSPFKLLLAGYAGAGNIGSDIRTLEMMRQFETILGKKNVKMNLMIISKAYANSVFPQKRLLHPTYTPSFLFKAVANHDGVITSEGSLFKSNFSPVLAWNMLGAMGFASSEEKLAVAYGAEAGQMDALTEQFAKNHCKKALVICRNAASKAELSSLKLRTALGADPAWTFEPKPTVDTKALLTLAGWDGKKPVIAICPMNPFWWPVRPHPKQAKSLKEKLPNQYHNSVFFHEESPEKIAQYQCYLKKLAAVIKILQKEKRFFPIIIGMERLDRTACEDLVKFIPDKIPILVSDQWDMHCIVSILRLSDYVISSRFHALVTALPEQVIPIGIAMDERIVNLLNDLGHPELICQANDPYLDEKILKLITSVNKDQIKKSIIKMIQKQIKLIGKMGILLIDEMERVAPNFRKRHLARTWSEHLPPLSDKLLQLLTL